MKQQFELSVRSYHDSTFSSFIRLEAETFNLPSLLIATRATSRSAPAYSRGIVVALDAISEFLVAF